MPTRSPTPTHETRKPEHKGDLLHGSNCMSVYEPACLFSLGPLNSGMLICALLAYNRSPHFIHLQAKHTSCCTGRCIKRKPAFSLICTPPTFSFICTSALLLLPNTSCPSPPSPLAFLFFLASGSVGRRFRLTCVYFEVGALTCITYEMKRS